MYLWVGERKAVSELRMYWCGRVCLRAAVSSYRSPPVGAAAGSLPSPGTSGWSGDRFLSAMWSADYWSTQVSANKFEK